MSDSLQPSGSTSPRSEQEKDATAAENAARRRPTLPPMASSVTTAPMRTRPPMTPLPPLAPKPPPPPERETETVKSPKRRVGLWLLLFVVFAAAAGGAYFQFMR